MMLPVGAAHKWTPAPPPIHCRLRFPLSTSAALHWLFSHAAHQLDKRILIGFLFLRQQVRD
jgi:hypothetical protein